MKKVIILSVIFVFFMSVNSYAGPADLTGNWSGTVYSEVCCGEENCNTIAIDATANIVQGEHGLFSGTFVADSYLHPCFGNIEGQSAILTGTISTNKRVNGVVGSTVPNDGLIPEHVQGSGIFQGTWSGNKMKAVLLDFYDGSTTVGILTKE